MTSVISIERVSELIGLVYDCVTQPARWETALEAIRAELDFLHGVLGVYDMQSGRPLLQFQAGMHPDWLDRMKHYGPEMAAYWGGFGRIDAHALDEPVSQTIAARGVDLEGIRFHREWVRPQSIADLVGIRLARQESSAGTLVFARHDSVGAAGDTELATLRLIAPHIRRAVTISGLFEHKAVAAATFSAALDALTLGVVLVDAQARVVHANRAGSQMLDRQDPISLADGCVTLPTPVAASALADAIARAGVDDLALGSRGIGIPARRNDGALSVVHVLRLRRDELRSGLQPRVVAGLFIAPTLTPPQTPIESVGMLHGLTPAEIRVFELVADGRPIAEIADQLSVADSTVRTHLQRVFEKTGTDRQIDLVKLAAALALPV